jgi:hypothetical protein
MPAIKKAKNATGANAAAAVHLPERLRDPAVFLEELAALCTNVEGLEVMVAGACHHCADPRVQTAVLVELKPLINGGGDSVKVNCQTVESNISKLFELGMLEAALAAMSAHAAESAVQASAWSMLASLVSYLQHATAICTKFAELGGIAGVIGAFDVFPRDHELVNDVVRVLGIAARDHTAQIISLGGIERVLESMDNHPEGGFGVCWHAIWALYLMSDSSPALEESMRFAMAAPDADALTAKYGQKLLDWLPAVDFATYIFTQCVCIYVYIIYMHTYTHTHTHTH